MRIAQNAAATPHSGIREIAHRAIDRKSVVRLEVGESSLPTPQHVIQAAARDAALGFTRYTASAGYTELRKAICEKLSRVNGVVATPDNVIVTSGGVQALFVVLAALCEAGDTVLLPDPAWPNYEMICRLIGARCKAYPCRVENGFLPDVDEVEELVSRRTRVLVVNSPNNPTGAVYPPELMRAFADLAERRGLTLVSDEAYDELYLDVPATSPTSFAPLDAGPVVSVFSFSKTYAMTGWRVGYAVGPEPLARVLAKLQEPTISCASAVSQRAALGALAGPQDFVAHQRDFLRERRDLVVDLLRANAEFTYRIEGAFYLLLDVRPLPSREFALDLLEHEAIAVAPGSAFGAGAEGFVRICYAAGGDALADAIRRLVGLKRERTADAAGAFASGSVALLADREEAV